MGAIAKGIGSLVGGRARRREQKDANKEFNQAKQSLQGFDFKNHFSGIQGGAPDVANLGAAAQQQVAQLGPAATYEAQGYESQGYDAQGYEAERAEAAQAQRTELGEDTGLTNQFQDLQVNTAQADRQAQESDEALAAQQELIAATGGGGATALAMQAAKAKQGVADTIGAQEAQNQQLRAQGATSIQQQNLAQRNTARQANIQQDQFNTGLQQQTNLANQAAGNQAAQFGASAQNQAAQFGAAAANQAAQFGAAAQNQAGQFNAGAKNQFAQAQFNAQNAANANNAGSQNQFALAQFGAQNQANNVGANQNFQAQQLAAQGAQTQEANRFGLQQQQLQLASGRKAQADQARDKATGDLVGGITGVAGALFSDENLKENIKKVGESPSGINIYQFNYIGDDITYEGVIAQEVEHAAIFDEEVGYYKVDYSKIDVDFKQV